MGRNVLVDISNVFNSINRGNQTTAEQLSRMRASGATLYYDQQGYMEAVTNNSLQGAANRQTLQDFGFQLAPNGDAALRADFNTLNNLATQGRSATIQDGASFRPNPDPSSSQKNVLVESKGIGNMRDAGLAATAYANGYEVFSKDGGFASPGKQNEIKQVFTKEISANAGEAAIRGRGLQIAQESLAAYNVRDPNPKPDANIGRRLLGLPEFTTAGRGDPVGPMNSGTPGMADPETAQTKALGVAMAAGVIVGWLDDYCIDRDMNKDVKEWEDYILKRRQMDPEQGFLLVAIIKVWRPRDAVYETRSYVSMEMVEDYTQWNAEARAAKSILPGLPPPTETVWYTYKKIWIPAVQPRPTLTADQKDEKLYGERPWYPRYQLVRHSLEEPADYGEALGVLQGSSMFDILRVLDALPPSQYNALKSQLYVVKEAGNRSRFRIAFAAVEDHRSSSSFGSWQFLQTYSGDYAALGNDFERNCVKDWVDSGSGAISNTLQGRWEVIWKGIYFEYSFYLSGKSIWRDRNNLGAIGGEGTWTLASDAVRVQWPQTGTVEKFNLPLDTNKETATTQMKSGTFSMTARKINPYP